MNWQLTTHASLCVVLSSSGIKDNFGAMLSRTKIKSKIQTVQKSVAKKTNIAFLCLHCA